MIRAYIFCQFKRQSYYYFDTIMTIFGAILAAVIQYFVWSSTQKTGNISLANSETISSYAILATAYTILMPASEVSKTIEYQTRKGTILYDLLRPINYWKNILLTQLGKSMYLVVFTVFPLIFVYVFAFHIRVPFVSLAATLLTLISFLLGYLLSFVIGFLIGICSFVTFRNGGLLSLYMGLVMIFGGGILPITIYPHWLAKISIYTPFYAMQGMPLLAMTMTQINFQNLWIQIFWLFTFIMITMNVYAKLRSHVEVSGG